MHRNESTARRPGAVSPTKRKGNTYHIAGHRGRPFIPYLGLHHDKAQTNTHPSGGVSAIESRACQASRGPVWDRRHDLGPCFSAPLTTAFSPTYRGRYQRQTAVSLGHETLIGMDLASAAPVRHADVGGQDAVDAWGRGKAPKKHSRATWTKNHQVRGNTTSDEIAPRGRRPRGRPRWPGATLGRRSRGRATED